MITICRIYLILIWDIQKFNKKKTYFKNMQQAVYSSIVENRLIGQHQFLHGHNTTLYLKRQKDGPRRFFFSF